jgi:hypothetical protein
MPVGVLLSIPFTFHRRLPSPERAYTRTVSMSTQPNDVTTTTTTQQNHVHATADLLTQEGGQPRENTKTQTKVAPGAQH